MENKQNYQSSPGYKYTDLSDEINNLPELLTCNTAIDIGCRHGSYTGALHKKYKFNKYIYFEIDTLHISYFKKNTDDIPNIQLNNIGLIKIDVDVPDRLVLNGSLSTIARCKPIIQIEAESIQVERDPAIFNKSQVYSILLEEYNYKVYSNDRNVILVPNL